MHTTETKKQCNQQTKIDGEVTHIVFYAEDTGYSIFKVTQENSKNEIAIVGHAPSLHIGQNIQAEGTWIQNKHYGKQFKAEKIHLSQPTSPAAVKQYLASGLIKGIGKKTAEKLVNHFPNNILEIITKKHEQLAKIPGISKEKARKIHHAWNNQKHINDIMLFLHEHGIGTTRAIRIYKIYGVQAISKIQENPYRLCHDMHGVGFKTADQLALSLGFEKNNSFRLTSGTLHALNEYTQAGHSAIEEGQLIEKAAELLETSNETIHTTLTNMLQESKLSNDYIQGQKIIYLNHLYQAEVYIAEKINNLLHSPSHLPEAHQLQDKLNNIEKNIGYQLSSSQHSALKTILSHKVSILTGGPGVGKTTLVKSVTQILSKAHVIISIMAPTGRAAKRLQESTSMQAKTIHRSLIVDPISKKFQHNHSNPLKTEYCIIDESSMLDIQLFAQLLSALPAYCGLLLVGDIDQLPSVGPGTILKDLIDFKRIPTIALSEIFRQAQTSTIVQYSHLVRKAKTPDFNYDKNALQDCYFIDIDSEEKFYNTLTQLLLKRIPERFGISNPHDIQILCPMRKGPYGTEKLNKQIQELLNSKAKTALKHGVTEYKEGDKVMQLRNNYDKDVFNGDIGIIKKINKEEQYVSIYFEDKYVNYYLDELDEITLAYAMTIHKSQGSEFPVVIMPLFTSHYMMLQRNLVYTGMTRGKKLLLILGQKKALHMAIKDQGQATRIGFLPHHLEQKHKKTL